MVKRRNNNDISKNNNLLNESSKSDEDSLVDNSSSNEEKTVVNNSLLKNQFKNKSFNFEKESEKHKNLFENKNKFYCFSFILNILFVFSFILEVKIYDLDWMEKSIDRFFLNWNTSIKPNQIDDIQKSMVHFIEKIDSMNEVIKINSNKFSYLYSSLNNFNIDYNLVNEKIILGFNVFNAMRINIRSKKVDNLNETETKSFFWKGDYSEKEWTDVKLELLDTLTKYNIYTKAPIELFEYEMMFYNINLQTSYYFKIINSSSIETFNKKSLNKELFLPNINVISGKYQTENLTLIIFKFFYIFYIIFLIYKFILETLRNYIIEIYSKKVFNFKFRDFFDLGYIIVTIIYFVIYFRVIFRGFNFLYILKNNQEFDTTLQFARFQENLFIYRLIIIIYLISKLIEMIEIKFYQYLKIFFYSLYKIKNDLLVFFITVGFMLLTFFSFGNMILQRYESGFGSIESTLEIMLLSIFQNYSFPTSSITAHKKDNIVVPLFLFIIFIMINTLCLQFLLGLIISKYTNYKAKYQKILEAVVKLNNVKSRDFYYKIWSLIQFKPYCKNYETIETTIKNDKNVNIFDEKYKEEKQNEEDKEELNNEINENILLDIFKQNIESFDMLNKLNDNEIGRDDYLDSIRKLKCEIKEDKEKLMKDSIKELKEYTVVKSLKFFLYLAYIFFFSTTILSHIKIEERNENFLSFWNYHHQQKISIDNYNFKLKNIVNYQDLNNFIIHFIQKINETNDKIHRISSSSFIFNPKLIRFGSKKLILNESLFLERTDVKDNYIYVLDRPRENYFFHFFFKSPNYQQADFISNSNNIRIQYNPLNEFFTLYLVDDDDKNKNSKYYNDLIDFFKNEKFINLDTSEFFIEYFLQNFNTLNFSYVKLFFKINSAGIIIPKVNIYNNNNRHFYYGSNLTIFIFYLLLFLIFFVLFVIEIKKVYYSPYILSFTLYRKNLEKKAKISKFLNKDINSIKNMFLFFFYFVNQIYLKIKQIVLTIYYFLHLKNLFIFQMLSIILTFISFIYLILIIVYSNYFERIFDNIISNKEFEFEQEIIFQNFNSLNNYFYAYRIIQSLNSWFLICGIFIYFSFSYKLSILFNTIKLAYNEIVSYIYIFLILIIGYGVTGFIIYGKSLENFNTIILSSFQMLLITIGAFDYKELKSVSSTITPIFIFSFLIIAVVIFLKMFIVILYSTYNEFVLNYEKKSENIIKFLINTCKKVFNYVKKIIKNKKLDTGEDKNKNKKNFLYKAKQFFFNVIIKKIENLIWQILKKLFFLWGKTINQGVGEIEVNKDLHVYKNLENYCENNKNLIEKNRFKNIPFFNNYLLNIRNELDNKENNINSKEIDSYLVWFNMLKNFLYKSTNSLDNLEVSKEETMKKFNIEKEFIFDNNDIKNILNEINSNQKENKNNLFDITSNTTLLKEDIEQTEDSVKIFYQNFRILIFRYLNEKYQDNEKSSLNLELNNSNNDIYYSIELISLTKSKVIEELILDKTFLTKINNEWFNIPIENRISVFYFNNKEFFKFKYILWNLIRITKKRIKLNTKKEKIEIDQDFKNKFGNIDNMINIKKNKKKKTKTNTNIFSGKYEEVTWNIIMNDYKINITKLKNKNYVKKYFKVYNGFDSISHKSQLNGDSLNIINDNKNLNYDLYFSLLSLYDLKFYENLEINSISWSKKVSYLMKYKDIINFEKLLLFLSFNFYERMELLLLIKNENELEFFSIFVIEELITSDFSKFSVVSKYYDNYIKKIYNDLLLLSTQNWFLKMNEEKNIGNKSLFSKNNMANYIEFLENKIKYYKELEITLNGKIDQKIKIKNLEVKNSMNLDNFLKNSYIKKN